MELTLVNLGANRPSGYSWTFSPEEEEEADASCALRMKSAWGRPEDGIPVVGALAS